MPEELRERLLSASDAGGKLDEEMGSVRDEIMDAQNTNRRRAKVVTDILNNIENLYHIANEREVTKIQNEFFDIYKRNDMELLNRFNKQLDVLSETYNAQSIQSLAGNFMDI